MSSASIMAQIQQCEQRIAACEISIRGLENKIAAQEHQQARFTGKSHDFQDQLDCEDRNRRAIAEMAHQVTMAERFDERVATHFSRQGEQVYLLDNINATLRSHIDRNNSSLEQHKRELLRLQAELGSLQAAYQAARRHEAEQAAQAARASQRTTGRR